jgi:hypothetical protein
VVGGRKRTLDVFLAPKKPKMRAGRWCVVAPHCYLPQPSPTETTANGLGLLLHSLALGGGHQGGRGTMAAHLG